MKQKNILEKYVFMLIVLIMIGLPLIKFCAYILNFLGIIEDPFSFNHVYVLWISIPFLLTSYLYGLKKQYFRFDYNDIIISILAFLGLISTVLAQDVQTSIFGEYHRNEGLLTLIAYYLIFLNVKNLTNSKYKHKIINLFIYIGLFQIGYAVLQVYTDLPFIKEYPYKPYMAMGLCSNPNFFGSYTTILCLITTSLYLFEKQIKYLVYSIIFFIGICLAGSTGPMIGFILAFLFLIIYYFKKINFSHICLILIVFISLFYIIDFSINKISAQVHDVEIDTNYNIKKETEMIVSNKTDVTAFGNGRIQLWKNLLPEALKYSLYGAGIDNVKVIYPKNLGLVFDKAHNVYLQIWITNGIFALIFYCLLQLIIFIRGLKIKDNFYISLFISFIGYAISAFANISVIEVAPYFFIILGLLVSHKIEEERL